MIPIDEILKKSSPELKIALAAIGAFIVVVTIMSKHSQFKLNDARLELTELQINELKNQ